MDCFFFAWHLVSVCLYFFGLIYSFRYIRTNVMVITLIFTLGFNPFIMLQLLKLLPVAVLSNYQSQFLLTSGAC